MVVGIACCQSEGCDGEEVDGEDIAFLVIWVGSGV